MGRAKSEREPRRNEYACSGISYIKSQSKWLAIIKLKGMLHPQFHVGYKPTEKEAIELRDQALISKVYGPRAETFFEKENYDVEELEKYYWDHVFERGVELSQYNRLDTGRSCEEGYMNKMTCSEKTETGLTVEMKHHGIDKPIVIGEAENEEEAQKMADEYLQSDFYTEHKKDIEEARALAEATYLKFPEEANFDLMNYLHKGLKADTIEALMSGEGGGDVDRFKEKFKDFDWEIFSKKEKFDDFMKALQPEVIPILQGLSVSEES